jgi:methylenetetrahydrofolate dehydrogenase (NADP+)/methenyltetrahydrofolate cyclohydrolase
MLIDGRKINQEIGEKLKKEIEDKKVKPSLGILSVGSDPASQSFIKVKKKFGESYGFIVDILNLGDQTSLENIKEELMNLQNKNDAVIVQLPLPDNLKENTDELLSLIDKEKDVDNLNDGKFEAPIVLALEKVLEQTSSRGKFGIIGLGQVVGMPIKNYLEKNKEKNNWEVQVIKKGEEEKIKECDVVISAVGQPFFIKKELIKEGSVLIDYGCSFIVDPRGSTQACGDFDPECFAHASYYTPVPGCMGPLVVACLFENVLKSSIR